MLNLISRKDTEHIVEAHLLPSLAILKKISFQMNSTVLDIGTGGGFPGLPLAISTPFAHFTLIDSIGKKIKAVEEFISILGLKNVTCIHNRVENFHQKYNFIIGRSVTDVDSFYTLAKPHLRTQGKILYLTGGDIPLKKSTMVIDLFDLYEHRFCETKKLLIITSP